MFTEDKKTTLVTNAAKPSDAATRSSLLTAFVAGEVCSICSTFFAHFLRPPSVYVVDRYTHRRLLPGQVGNLEEVFNWDGLIPILVLSFIVFILSWCVMYAAAKYARQPRRMIAMRSGRVFEKDSPSCGVEPAQVQLAAHSANGSSRLEKMTLWT